MGSDYQITRCIGTTSGSAPPADIDLFPSGTFMNTDSSSALRRVPPWRKLFKVAITNCWTPAFCKSWALRVAWWRLECHNLGNSKCTGQFGQNCLGQTWSDQTWSGQTGFWRKFVGQTWFWPKFVWSNMVLAWPKFVWPHPNWTSSFLVQSDKLAIVLHLLLAPVGTVVKPAKHEVVRHQSPIPGASRCFPMSHRLMPWSTGGRARV